MVSRFTARIGRQTIGAYVPGNEAAYTRQTRASMSHIIREFERFVNHMEDVTPEILMHALKPAFDLSQKYVPVDTGALRKSGYLETVSFRGSPKVEIGYGRSGVPFYAGAVHENLEWAHKAPTQAKFLQRALEESQPQVQARIIEGLKQGAGT